MNNLNCKISIIEENTLSFHTMRGLLEKTGYNIQYLKSINLKALKKYRNNNSRLL